MKDSVSQQLSVLRSKNIVIGRKEGKNVLYSLHNASTVDLLNVARELFNNHLIDTLSMYEELEDQKNSTKKKGL